MRSSRRNTIIGVGTLAAGAGVIGGSGAFDSVSASRSFEVGVSGSASAQLGMKATNDVIAGIKNGNAGDKQIIYFRLNDCGGGSASLNEDSTTEFYDVMRVRNNGDKEVTFSFILDGMSGVTSLMDNGNDGTAEKDLTTKRHTLSDRASVLVDPRIDTTDAGGCVEPTGSDPYQVTARAVS